MKLFDLAGEQVIVSDNSLALGISIDDAIGRSMIDLTRRSRINSIGLMTEMARLNLGVVLQTKLGIESEVAEGALFFVPLRDVSHESAPADAARPTGARNVRRGLRIRGVAGQDGRGIGTSSCCVLRIQDEKIYLYLEQPRFARFPELEGMP